MKTTLEQFGFTATINHDGAELVSLRKNNTEYIWEGNPEFWGKHSPVLFPIVGTLKENTYRHGGKQYHLPRHGFARDRVFELVSKTDATAVFSIASDPQTMAVYPFGFELQIIYTLTHQGLTIGYLVCNRSDETMPFAIGAHPAFALPGNFEDYHLEFEKNETPVYHLLENDLISNRTASLVLDNQKLPFDYALFANDALVFKKLESKSLTICKDDAPLLTVAFDGFPNLGLWTKPGAPFLCIEPWFGYADTPESTGELTDKEGILSLAPHGNFETKFSITIR